jgi:hypothetical protein
VEILHRQASRSAVSSLLKSTRTVEESGSQSAGIGTPSCPRVNVDELPVDRADEVPGGVAVGLDS